MYSRKYWKSGVKYLGSKNMESLVSQVLDFKELIDYQDGSVVSRELLTKKTGNITLFAFDRGQGLSEHTAPFDATVFCIEGEVEITISGKPYRVKAGEMLIMPANQPHSLQAVERFKMLLTMIRV